MFEITDCDLETSWLDRSADLCTGRVCLIGMYFYFNVLNEAVAICDRLTIVKNRQDMVQITASFPARR